MIMAILMAGGKGSRLKSNIEKPLLKFQNSALIDHVIKAIDGSRYIDKIIVSTSLNTVKTEKYLSLNYPVNLLNNKLNEGDFKLDLNENYNNTEYFGNKKDLKPQLNILMTSGLGYLKDLSFILSIFEKNSNKDILVFITADLPLISSDIIDHAIENYFNSGKESLSIMIPYPIFKENNLKPSIVFDDLVPSGLNILLSQNKTQDEERLIIPKIELAFNINTLNDLKFLNDNFG
ncbi:MAG: NTP transferase domain-containing protein [Methanobrevibacter sp.]|nr:NTP transferase domain-containing protein [Methanobrevibacter sp.]